MLATIGLITIFLALWCYTKIRARIEIKVHQVPAPSIKRSSQPMSVDAASLRDIEQKIIKEKQLLEEAELYANLGRPETSIKILQEILQRHSSNPVAWFLLLSCYSSLGKAVEFDKAAREFLKRHEDNQVWRKIQALGRTLDPQNRLYIDNNARMPAHTEFSNAADQIRSIGEILKKTGVVTDLILQHYLSRFNPKNHGRFGGFLLKNKVITLGQLNRALMLQQSVHA